MLEILLENRVDAQRIFSMVLILAMWKWGRGPERWIASTWFVLFLLPFLVSSTFHGSPLLFTQGGLLYAAIDLLATAIFLGIALNANRNYPLWIAGFQVVAMAAHLTRGLADAVTPLAYAILVIGPSYFQLAIMLVGLIRHVRRQKQYGGYRDWRTSEPIAAMQPPEAGRT